MSYICILSYIHILGSLYFLRKVHLVSSSRQEADTHLFPLIPAVMIPQLYTICKLLWKHL